MKKIMAAAVFAVVLCLFAGCGKTVSYKDNLDAYVRELDYREGFTVLQLTDMHWSNASQLGDDDYGCISYMKKVIAEAQNHCGKIDLLEFTGDTFMLTDKASIEKFIKVMEEIKIPYAINWGNHDREGKYNPDWLIKQFENAPYSLYTEVDNDDVHERGNYVINLVGSDGSVKWQIAHIDSGANYRSGAKDIFLTYDYIREDQFEWFEAEHKAAGDDVPVICFYHIPQADNTLGYEAIENGADYKHKFFKYEDFCESDYAVTTAEVFARNNVKGAFSGHAHATDYTFTDPNGIIYGLGVKTGKELCCTEIEKGNTDGGFEVTEDFEMTGATLFTLGNEDGEFKLEHLYLNERDGGDFVLWVEY